MNETFNIRTFVRPKGRTYSESLMKRCNPKFIYSQQERLEILMAKPELISNDFFECRAAATYLGVSESYLYRLNRNNKIRSYRTDGKLHFKTDDLNLWLKSRWPVCDFELHVSIRQQMQNIEEGRLKWKKS